MAAAKKRMQSAIALLVIPHIPKGMSGQIAVASVVATICLFSGYTAPIMNHEAFQVLALTIFSIVAVAVVAGILICIPDFVDGNHRTRRRGRGRTRTRQGNNSNNSRQSNWFRERLNQNNYPSASTTKSQSMNSTTSASRKKTPSMPPLSPAGTSGGSTSKNAPGRVPVSGLSTPRKISPRRFSSPPALPSPTNPSQYSLNPIVERKLEDLMDYDDYWWRELDSRTQYYALILGYTQVTWDDDFELDDLPCEDWDWEEMTKEQKAAAQHFGYTRESWSE